MSAPTRVHILTLYGSMLRTSRTFSSYNFRTYFERSTRQKFRDHMGEKDPAVAKSLYEEGVKELEVLKRAAFVNRLYQGPKLVVEKGQPTWAGRVAPAI